MIRVFTFFLLFLLFLTKGVSQEFSSEQQNQIDSLNKLINSPSSLDTVKIKANLKLVTYYFRHQPDSAIVLCFRAKGIAEKINSLEHMSNSYGWLGYLLKKQGDIPLALEYYDKGLTVAKQMKNKQLISIALNNIGLIYKKQNELDRALKYYIESLAIEEELDNKIGVASQLNNIAVIYNSEIDNYLHQNVSPEKINDKRNQTLDLYQRSLKIYEELDDSQGLAIVYNNIGSLFRKHAEMMIKNRINSDSIRVKTDQSLEFYHKSLTIEKEIGNQQGIATSQVNIGVVHLRQNDIIEAKRYGELSLEIAKDLGYPESIQKSAILLSRVYERQNKGIKALEMYKLHVEMRDSTHNLKTQKAASQQQAKYEYDKKKELDDLQHEKLMAVEKEANSKQRVISYAISFGLILTVIFLFFVFNRLKLTRKQKRVIEEQNTEIVDSITYAKRIQEAILPSSELVKKLFPDSFIYYKPKDIVAGDFYWLDKKEGNILFAVADCTGHGVPGAMVSVVCHNAMNSVIKEFNIMDPGQILDKTRELVIAQLNKTDLNEISNIRDGMDIALCVLNTKTNSLKYAGAYNPLWILRKEASEMEEIKAIRQSIGKVDNPKSFKTHEVKVEKGDTIYLFSDGFADQFGGEKGKKMMYKPFKNLLISMKDEPMTNQLSMINEHFQTWKGDIEQIDDVCVLGIKF